MVSPCETKLDNFSGVVSEVEVRTNSITSNIEKTNNNESSYKCCGCCNNTTPNEKQLKRF